MHILFDEAGKLMTGRLLSEAENSLQVELDSGKRVKVKAANALLRFDKPAPAQLMPAATALADSMELELAYEFAPEDEFGFADLAHEYFSANAGTPEQVAALLCLQGAPHYFRRAGKGRYKKAPPDILAQALAAIEKKKQVPSLRPASVRHRCASSSTASCSDPTRTRPNTRPWWRHRI
jgi:exoribonuclease-2